jgi:EAL domain-containing protein (putative c-di-GMP-specific phosphodiesterase class I)
MVRTRSGGESNRGSALQQFARWSLDSDISVKYVSVNVLARQFRTPGFVDQVREALAAANSSPSCLLLEITESLLLRDADQVWADLRMLRSPECGSRSTTSAPGTRR